MVTRKIRIGVLAIQGAFTEHKNALSSCCKTMSTPIEVFEIRSVNDISGDIDGLILPGGESTSMGNLLNEDGFGDKLKDIILGRQPPVVWGTCGGLIMLANEIENQKQGGQYHIGGIDVTVSRNFFGRQINSFEGPVVLNENVFDQSLFHGVFIRAPAVTKVHNEKVKILGHVTRNSETVVVAVQQRHLLATSFHPELNDDYMWQAYFLKMIEDHQATN